LAIDHTHTKKGIKMIGYFTHKETGAMFEYDHAGADTVLAPPPHGGRNMAYTHRVHLNNDLHGQGWRHALVRGGVAYVITDEREDDGTTFLVAERWPITRHYKF
jgi:hypothetical protein